ncbi:hypothetical protein Tco_0190306 [Tanacetum coccineum]
MANPPPDHNEFALVAEAAPDNMNGWVEWDEDEEEEDPEMEEEEEDPEMEEEEEEMDVDANEEGDGLEWILPYEGADPLNPPPPVSDSEYEIEEAAPMPSPHIPADHEPEAEAATVGTGRLEPSLDVDSSPTLRSDLNALHRKKHLPPHLHYQEAPYVPPTALVVPVAHDDPRDPYVAACDAATVSAIDDDGPAACEETSPSEPQGFPPCDS